MGIGCKQDHTSALQQLREERDKVETGLVETKRVAAKLRLELEAARKVQAQASDAFDQSRDSVRKVASACEAIAKAFTDYQDEYRATISKKAIGMSLGTLTVGIRTYAAVKVKGLDAWDLAIEHSEGVSRIPLRELPADLQTKFGYDPDVGEKPVAPITSVASAPPDVSSPSVLPSPEVGSGSLPAPVPSQQRPVTVGRRDESSDRSSSGKSSAKTDSGTTIEVLSRWRAGGGGGGGSTGSKVKGATAPLPSGYKPIGSNYSGTAMDRNKKK